MLELVLCFTSICHKRKAETSIYFHLLEKLEWFWGTRKNTSHNSVWDPHLQTKMRKRWKSTVLKKSSAELGQNPTFLAVRPSSLCYTILHACSVTQSCPTLCDLMDYSQPGSSVHGIFQAKILEWVAISFSRGSYQPRDQTHISCIGRQILYHWMTWEAHTILNDILFPCRQDSWHKVSQKAIRW